MSLFKRKPKFTKNEYIAIKVLSQEYLKSMSKEKNPDEHLKVVVSTLESIKGKVEHIV